VPCENKFRASIACCWLILRGLSKTDALEEYKTGTINKGVSSPVILFFARLVSYVCHPIFMPIIIAISLTRLSPNSFAGISERQLGLWLISITTTAVLFPLVSIALMKQLGFVSSFQMSTARERTIPLMATMIFYFWISQVFNRMPGTAVPLIFKVFFLGNLWGIIVIFMINIFVKVSMHSSAAGGMVGIMTVLLIMSPVNMLVPFFVSLLIAGIIGSARLLMGAHQRGDVWLGYVVGVLVQLGAYLYMK
jgi:hypothetical protein